MYCYHFLFVVFDWNLRVCCQVMCSLVPRLPPRSNKNEKGTPPYSTSSHREEHRNEAGDVHCTVAAVPCTQPSSTSFW